MVPRVSASLATPELIAVQNIPRYRRLTSLISSNVVFTAKCELKFLSSAAVFRCWSVPIGKSSGD